MIYLTFCFMLSYFQSRYFKKQNQKMSFQLFLFSHVIVASLTLSMFFLLKSAWHEWLTSLGEQENKINKLSVSNVLHTVSKT